MWMWHLWTWVSGLGSAGECLDLGVWEGFSNPSVSVIPLLFARLPCLCSVTQTCPDQTPERFYYGLH